MTLNKKNSTKIMASDIMPRTRFKTDTGIVWVIDQLENDPKFGVLVCSSMEDGVKGNYRDTMQTVVDFLNEQGSAKITD